MLKPGIYRLKEDLPNPMKVDRRKSDWEFQPDFKAGRLFIRTDLDAVIDAPLPKLGMYQNGVWIYRTVKRVQPLADALEDKVEMVEPLSSLEMLALYHRQVLLNNAGTNLIVETLLKEGALTMERINEILHQINRPAKKIG